MPNRVLVTYASRSGSTAEVAEAIGKRLSAVETQVDVLPMSEVGDLSPYQVVVAGSAAITVTGMRSAPGRKA